MCGVRDADLGQRPLRLFLSEASVADMAVLSVERLVEVPLREVWRDEAGIFTPWLAQNPDYLSEALGMDLELVGTEVPVGPFWADIVLVDGNSGRRVVVENFLKATDHDHLGKLITYTAGLEGSYAVLVARTLRPEHRSALMWLNEIAASDAGFFGIEVHAVRIGSSAPAVRLDVVVEPDEWRRQARESVGGQRSESQSRWIEWWSEFIPALQAAYPGWTNATQPLPRNYIHLPARPGIRYSVSFSWPPGAPRHRLRVALYLVDGAKWWPYLEARRHEIDSALGPGVSWEPLEDAKASRIALYFGDVDPDDRDMWPTYRTWAIEKLGDLRKVLQPIIDAAAP
jgi:hypothetical protein